jgi:hypothetical protein
MLPYKFFLTEQHYANKAAEAKPLDDDLGLNVGVCAETF